MTTDLNLPSDVKLEKEQDVVGGNIAESDVYPGTIILCYMDKSEGGAKNINIHFKSNTGITVRETVYISNKKGEFTYTDKKTNKSKPLPGYSQMNAFFEAVTGKGIGSQTIEEKTINIYDFTEKKNLPKKRDVFMDVHQKPALVAILKIQEEKTTAASGYKDGTGEFREKNEFVKWFDPSTGMTNTEKKDENPKAVFIETWKNKNQGRTITRKAANSGAAKGSTPGAPTPKGESLFK